MVDNQHTKIKGYRDLSEEEIALMNEIKAKAEECRVLVNKLYLKACPQPRPSEPERLLDERWVKIGETDLQTGFMALVRSVAQPTTF